MRKRISIEKAEEGMILARTVTNHQGIVLCADGTPLTADLIDRLRQMEVPGFWIRGEDKLSDREYLEVRTGIEKRFAAAGDSHTLLGKLRKVILNRLELLKGSS